MNWPVPLRFLSANFCKSHRRLGQVPAHARTRTCARTLFARLRSISPLRSLSLSLPPPPLVSYEHLILPVDNLWNKRKEQMLEAVADRAELEESRRVLTQMLRDYVDDQTNLPTSERAVKEVLSERCDLKVINDMLLEQMKTPFRNLVMGDILRLLLIDAERMKFDALVGLNKMNHILHSNFATIEGAALIPMFLVSCVLVFMDIISCQQDFLSFCSPSSSIARARMRSLCDECWL
jgi:hypothetical protein